MYCDGSHKGNAEFTCIKYSVHLDTQKCVHHFLYCLRNKGENDYSTKENYGKAGTGNTTAIILCIQNVGNK